jgi:hypothetical protein
MATLSDATKKLIKQLSGTYKVSLGLNDQFSVDKLGWLKRDKRDFTKITPQLVKSASSAMQKAASTVDATKPQQAVDFVLMKTGDAILKHILTRFAGGQRDVAMRPLSPGWIKIKGHNRIGIFSGDMFRDLINGKIKITRIK